MPHYNSVPSQFRRKRFLRQPLLVGLGATLLMVTGWLPTLRLRPDATEVSFGSGALAQAININSDELGRYAQSVAVIEPMRQTAYDEIKRILGSDEVPPIACHRPNSLNNLRPNIRQIATNYCNRAIEVVEENGLTIGRFNTITDTLHNRPEIMREVQDLILDLFQREN